MAESLRRLANIGSFTLLQDKLDKWLDDYHVNSCEQNTAQCVEIIELNSRVQGQLFKLLSLTAAEGGVYGGASVIKSRLLPWLGQGLVASGGAGLSLLADSAAKDRELNDIQDMYEKSLTDLERDLESTRAEADELKAELETTQDQLDATKRASASEKMFKESEVRDLRGKLRAAGEAAAALRRRGGGVGGAPLLGEYERDARRLREEIALLSAQRADMIDRLRMAQDDLLNLHRNLRNLRDDKRHLEDELTVTKRLSGSSDDSHGDWLADGLPEPERRPLPRPASPLDADDVTQRVRQRSLITRFTDLFATDRLDAMDVLKRYSSDVENNQRIVFAAMQEAFSAAKLAFTSFKMRVRSQLVGTHVGPETLEERVQDYINRNCDLYDLAALVSDVTRALTRNVRLYLPPDAPFSVIASFIREACKLAWGCAALAIPLDIVFATDAELFDGSRYRRSYDSDFVAPLVNHHVWPCLMQGSRVLVKGEAHTRRGASLTTPRGRSPARRSPSPSRRATSPTRSPSRARSASPRRRDRSPSPTRRFMNGAASPGARSPSRGSSSLASRAVTASTALSHYGFS